MLVTDYLVIGAGAASMAFIDTLLTESPDVSVTVVDRHARPGGHWNDAYGFVRLHQPSLLYGVASNQLEGNWLKLLATGTLPWAHRAGKNQILDYYQTTMDRWVQSGRVTYFPESTYDFENFEDVHKFKDERNGITNNIMVREKLINGVVGECRVPSTTKPNFDVQDGITLVTPNQVYSMKSNASWLSFRKSENAKKKYVVLGAGKTAMDTVVFLQRNLGVDPENITWVISNDVWMIRRSGPASPWTWGEALLEKNLDSNEAALDLEEKGAFERLDKKVLPTKFRFPLIGDDELIYLRQVKNVVRRGRVSAITSVGNDRMRVEFGQNDPLELSSGHIFVHCTSPGPFNGNKYVSPFTTEKEIRLFFLYAPPVPISMSCIAVLESRRRAGKLDIDFGRRLIDAIESTKVSENDVLRLLIPGYGLLSTAGLVTHGASKAHIEPLKNLAGFLAIFDADVKVGYQWLQRNRLSFFSIPGFKGKVFENVQKMVEKREVLGLSNKEVAVLSGLARRLKPLVGK